VLLLLGVMVARNDFKLSTTQARAAGWDQNLIFTGLSQNLGQL
jgi:hypothetical protein